MSDQLIGTEPLRQKHQTDTTSELVHTLDFIIDEYSSGPTGRMDIRTSIAYSFIVDSFTVKVMRAGDYAVVLNENTTVIARDGMKDTIGEWDCTVYYMKLHTGDVHTIYIDMDMAHQLTVDYK